MALGPFLRRHMTPSMERRLAGVYRSVFIDLHLVASVLAPKFIEGARVLDIGGGDGELLNHLLSLRPDIRITMLDIASSVGKFIEPEYRKQVTFLPGTPVEKFVEEATGSYDAALICDVMHHLPAAYRGEFLKSVSKSLVPDGRIFVKDIEPGFFISSLSLFCDKYISGDRGVKLISLKELKSVSCDAIPEYNAAEIGLLSRHAPNYLLQLEMGSH